MWRIGSTKLSGTSHAVHDLFSGRHSAQRKFIRESVMKASDEMARLKISKPKSEPVMKIVETAARPIISQPQTEPEDRLTSEKKKYN